MPALLQQPPNTMLHVWYRFDSPQVPSVELPANHDAAGGVALVVVELFVQFPD